jgi:hypothetical protein
MSGFRHDDKSLAGIIQSFRERMAHNIAVPATMRGAATHHSGARSSRLVNRHLFGLARLPTPVRIAFQSSAIVG